MSAISRLTAKANFMLSNKKKTQYEENIPYELVRLGYACNERCLFCNVECLPAERKFDDRVLRNVMKAALAAGDKPGGRISISGGEPGLYKGLPALIKLFKSKKASKLDIQTNALCFADRALAVSVAAAGATSAFVSLHSHSAKIHDFLTGIRGAHARCLRGIDNLLSCGLEVVLNPVVCSRNYREVKKYLAFVSKRFPEIKTVSLSVVQPRGRALENDYLIPDYAALASHVSAALSYADTAGITVNNPVCGLPLCVGGWHLRADKCVEASLSKLNRRQDLGKVYPAVCSACSVRAVCGGVWQEYLDIHGVSGLKPV